MAAKVVIDISAKFTDKLTPQIKNAQKQVDKFNNSIEKTEKQLNRLNRNKGGLVLTMKDGALNSCEAGVGRQTNNGAKNSAAAQKNGLIEESILKLATNLYEMEQSIASTMHGLKVSGDNGAQNSRAECKTGQPVSESITKTTDLAYRTILDTVQLLGAGGEASDSGSESGFGIASLDQVLKRAAEQGKPSPKAEGIGKKTNSDMIDSTFGATDTLLKYFKTQAGGQAHLVQYGIEALAAVKNVVKAPAGEQMRTAARETGGLVGSVALGSIGTYFGGPVGGIIGSGIGDAVGSWIGEASYDAFVVATRPWEKAGEQIAQASEGYGQAKVKKDVTKDLIGSYGEIKSQLDSKALSPEDRTIGQGYLAEIEDALTQMYPNIVVDTERKNGFTADTISRVQGQANRDYDNERNTLKYTLEDERDKVRNTNVKLPGLRAAVEGGEKQQKDDAVFTQTVGDLIQKWNRMQTTGKGDFYEIERQAKEYMKEFNIAPEPGYMDTQIDTLKSRYTDAEGRMATYEESKNTLDNAQTTVADYYDKSLKLGDFDELRANVKVIEDMQTAYATLENGNAIPDELVDKIEALIPGFADAADKQGVLRTGMDETRQASLKAADVVKDLNRDVSNLPSDKKINVDVIYSDSYTTTSATTGAAATSKSGSTSNLGAKDSSPAASSSSAKNPGKGVSFINGSERYEQGGMLNNWGLKFADGDIVSGPTYALIGEAGPEAIIPLSKNRRTRGISLWREAGMMLGQDPNEYESAGSVSSLIDGGGESINTQRTDANSAITMPINLGGVSFTMQIPPDGNTQDIMHIVKEKAAEIANILGVEMASNLVKIFENLSLQTMS